MSLPPRRLYFDRIENLKAKVLIGVGKGIVTHKFSNDVKRCDDKSGGGNEQMKGAIASAACRKRDQRSEMLYVVFIEVMARRYSPVTRIHMQ